MDMTSLLVQLVSGAAGGNIGGMLNKKGSLGPLLNSVLGAVGGVAGGQLLGGQLADMLGNATASNAGVAGLVGLVLPMVIGMFKKKTA